MSSLGDESMEMEASSISPTTEGHNDDAPVSEGTANNDDDEKMSAPKEEEETVGAPESASVAVGDTSTSSSSDMTTPPSPSASMRLHDLLSLGEIESALSSASKNDDGTELELLALSTRLPLLLRWLSVAQPLMTTSSSYHTPTASASASADNALGNNTSTSTPTPTKSKTTLPPDVNAIVPLLEEVAAAHPDAENVEVLVSSSSALSLAPSIFCKDAIGKLALAPLSRMKQIDGIITTSTSLSSNSVSGAGKVSITRWDTSKLDDVLQKLALPKTTNYYLSAAENITNSRKRQPEQNITTESTNANANAHEPVQQQHQQPAKKQKVVEKRKSSDALGLLEKMQLVIDILEEDDGHGPKVDDNDHEDDDDDDMQVDGDRKEEVVASAAILFDAQAPPSSSSFIAQASSDTHESAMRKALQELITLVKSSLLMHRTHHHHHHHNDGGINQHSGDTAEVGVAVAADEGHHQGDTNASSSSLAANDRFLQETGFASPGLTLKSDSLFIETEGASSFIGGGWSRLSVMIPTLMQHAPILRYEHVANALCRAAVPQAPSLIKVMAANSSAATQSLLRGCITAYQLARKYECIMCNNMAAAGDEGGSKLTSIKSEAKDIICTAVKSAQCLASLSRREALAAIRILKESGVMDGLVLSLMMEHDTVGAVAFVVEKLSSGPTSMSAEMVAKPEPTRFARSLRQRMVGANTTPVKQLPLRPVPSQLYRDLIEESELAGNVRDFLSQRMAHLVKTRQGSETRLGESSLLIQALALLLYSSGVGNESGLELVENTMMAIKEISTGGISDQDLPTQSPRDHIYNTAMCSVVIICCRYPPIGDMQDSVANDPAAEACLDCFQSLLFHPPSIESSIISARIAGFILHNDFASLQKVCLGGICYNGHSGHNEPEQPLRMANVCNWISSNTAETGTLKSTHEMGMTLGCLTHDPIVAIEAMQQCSPKKSSDLDGMVKRVLADAAVCAKIIRHHRVSALIQASVNMLVNRPSPYIPLVLPLSLERLAQSLPWNGIETNKNLTSKFPQFVLQVVYALEFVCRQPQSPFAISPRLFPLAESLAYLNAHHEKYGSKHNSGYRMLREMLRKLISAQCPDILQSMTNCSHLEGKHDLPKHNFSPIVVSKAIRSCLDQSMDPSGLRAEKMFMICRSMYPNQEIDVAAIGAILAKDKSQPRFYSYAALVKDPLILFKAPASVWKVRGLRCILIRILITLMTSNECISMQYSVTENAALEYLTARDTIIVRCIIFSCASGFAFGGGNTGKAHQPALCMMCVNLIRSIISKRRGIVATLIKQDLPSKCIEWIVEFVPEALFDGPVICSLVSEKGLLTATERLSAACTGLQIAVSHSHMDEEIVSKLVAASTAVLLDSFTLVIGPIGVPVSILREENGRDATNVVCREKMFRMIKTMASICPNDNDLKNEASITLSKIAAMCKSENSVGGVGGTAANRRKAVLKEIWEACLLANTALGGTMQM